MIKHFDPASPSNFRFELTQEEHDAGFVAFATGPLVAGSVSTIDGTVYDVTEDAVAVHRSHVGEMHLAIHRMHHAAGRYLDVPLPALEDVSLSEA